MTESIRLMDEVDATVTVPWPVDGEEDPGRLDGSEVFDVTGAMDLSDDEPDTTPEPMEPHEFSEKMFSLELACQAAEREVEEAKAIKKAADALYAQAVSALRNYIREVHGDMNRPLFDTLKPAKPAEPADNHADLMLQPIDVLDLPSSVAVKLEEAHVQTVGQLEKLRGEIALGNEKWPKGIGPAKVTAIEDAVTDWIAANYQESEKEKLC